MAGGQPIRDVVVAGAGLAGWSAAAALKRKLPALSVTLVAGTPPADSLADRMAPTLPSIVGFHGDLGIGEADSVLRAGSGFRLGTLFEGWSGAGPGYVHAYAPHGRAFPIGSFHQHWLRLAAEGAASAFDAYSVAATLARAGRFVHPQGEKGSPLGDFEYGLTIDPARYAQMMRAFAQHVGVVARPGDISGVELDGESGGIASLRLTDGAKLSGDLFVDCTGPAAKLRSALDSRFEPWEAWLPCDRVLLGQSAAPAELPSLDRAIALEAGWRWQAASPSRTSHGIVYLSSEIGDEEAARILESAGASFNKKDGSVWTTDKDGILLALLASEITAVTGKSPSQLYKGLTDQFGAPVYARIDAAATREQKAALGKLSPTDVTATELAGEPITAKLTEAPGNGASIGGLKVVTDSAWFAARPSGTEDVYKIYAESFKGEEHLKQVQAEAKALVDGVIA